MRTLRQLLWLMILAAIAWPMPVAQSAEPGPGVVYILPVRDNIMPPMVYLIRRGVKQAMEAKADFLLLDMDTNGGRVDTTEDILEILNQFPGKTATYVNRKAFSAGAFISVATQKIYMAPRSVIGAAAPIMVSPGGPAEVPETMEAKTTSGISALIRSTAQKNGHNPEVVEAMIDKNKELIIDGEVLNAKGEILTLTNVEAEKEYGNPPKPLLSAGTFESLDQLLNELNFPAHQRVYIQPTGAEKLGSWLNAISPLLLMIGLVGIYLEIKTPGFGLPGIAGIIAFSLYFLGSYVAGLSGLEWLAVFVLGLVLLILELFLFPGTLIVGLAGTGLMIMAIIMAMVDMYPGMPSWPSLGQLNQSLQNLLLAAVGSGVAIWLLSFFLPKTPIYHQLVSQSASGMESVNLDETRQTRQIGQTGVTISPLRPGGKAQFGDKILDVISQGELIPKGSQVRIIGHSGTDPIVEVIPS